MTKQPHEMTETELREEIAAFTNKRKEMANQELEAIKMISDFHNRRPGFFRAGETSQVTELRLSTLIMRLQDELGSRFSREPVQDYCHE